MSVELDPVELSFRRPFTQEVSQTLGLRNPNSDPVAFKVKTTAPKQYCVRPNSGRIEPGEIVDVLVLLQAMKEDPPLDAKCRDKFLVQSVALKADQKFTNVADVWSNIEQTAKSSILEKKIRVSFLPADGSAVTPSKPGQHEEEPPAYSSPYSTANTPAPVAAVGASSKPSERPTDSKNLGEIKNEGGGLAEQSYVGAAAGGVVAAASTAAAAIPRSSEDVGQQLKAAQAQIASLKEQIASGLRQRKAASDTTQSSTTTASIQQAAATGVPVPQVAGLCLLCFLLAYLFF